MELTGDLQVDLWMLDAELMIRKRNSKLFALRGDIKIDLKEYEGAIEDYTKAIKLCRKQRFELFWKRSNAYDHIGSNLAALNDISIAHSLKPRCTAIIVSMGQTYKRFSDYKKAEECYKDAIKINRKFIDPYLLLGSLKIENEEYLEALKYFNRGVNLNPSDPEARFYRGLVLLLLKRFDEALEDCEMSVILDPSNIPARQNKAAALFFLKEYGKAKKEVLYILHYKSDEEKALELLKEIEDETEGEEWKMAKKATSDLCFGKQVKVVQSGTDRYGRVLAFVFVGNVCVNEELLREGMAWHYKKYNQDENLAQLENTARRLKIGLWRMKGIVSPWDWRKI